MHKLIRLKDDEDFEIRARRLFCVMNARAAIHYNTNCVYIYIYINIHSILIIGPDRSVCSARLRISAANDWEEEKTPSPLVTHRAFQVHSADLSVFSANDP